MIGCQIFTHFSAIFLSYDMLFGLVFMLSFPLSLFFAFLSPDKFFLSLFLNFFFLLLQNAPDNAIIKSMKKALYFYRQAAVYLACILLLAVLLLLPRLLCHEHRLHGGRCLYGSTCRIGISPLPTTASGSGPTVSRAETFVSRAQAICDSLGVTAITFPLHEAFCRGRSGEVFLYHRLCARRRFYR